MTSVHGSRLVSEEYCRCTVRLYRTVWLVRSTASKLKKDGNKTLPKRLKLLIYRTAELLLSARTTQHNATHQTKHENYRNNIY
jgi:hypothetical protein